MGGTVAARVGTVPRMEVDQGSTAAWLASGVAGLTGRADGPALLPSAATADAITALVAGAPVEEPLVLLGERVAMAGHTRAGSTSCGGSARLLPAGDGWVAVNLARPDDLDLLPAWLGLGDPGPDPWPVVAEALCARSSHDLVAGACELGLPVSRVGEAAAPVLAPHSGAMTPQSGASSARPSAAGPGGGSGVLTSPIADREPLRGPPLVVDLSSLWAGPLCSHLLGCGGARVVKVESTRRPDGARADETGFFDLLNHGKQSVALDLPSTVGLARLRALLAAADVVIEGSRPRALGQWGIEAEAFLRRDPGPRVWVSITGHGRSGPAAHRVGFGDDAAAAGGLVVSDADGPCFLADAVADPLTGAAAAAATTDALADGGTWLLDAALARVAASVVRPGPSIAVDGPVSAPRARPVVGRARPLGADTATALADLAS